MDDEKKTRNELLEEIRALKRKLEKAETPPSETAPILPVDKPFFERAPRIRFTADIEFIGDFDVIRATGVNVSDTGICFEVNGDLPFEMQYEAGGRLHRHRALLVWVKQLPEGGYRFGLKFVPGESNPEF